MIILLVAIIISIILLIFIKRIRLNTLKIDL
jgi:hypothetical protein